MATARHILQALLFISFFKYIFLYSLLLNNNTFYCPSDIVLTHIKQYIHTYFIIYIFYMSALIAYSVINNIKCINIYV